MDVLRFSFFSIFGPLSLSVRGDVNGGLRMGGEDVVDDGCFKEK